MVIKKETDREAEGWQSEKEVSVVENSLLGIKHMPTLSSIAEKFSVIYVMAASCKIFQALI